MLKFILKILFYLCGFVCVIMFTPGSILLNIHPKAYFHALPKTMEGPLSENDFLSRGKKLFENVIVGPESLAVYNGRVVTGAEDGYIYEIIGGTTIKPITKLVNSECDNQPWNKTGCGRPIGMQFDTNGTLYAVDPDLGVFSVENIFTTKPKVSLVFDIKETAALGRASKFFDDVTVDSGAGVNGGNVLYVSDVSTAFSAWETTLIVGGSETGRIVRYDINAKKVELVTDGLLFPNGIEISDDRNSIIFTEYIARQIHKHYIKGPKAGQTEVLVTMLPGEPDNIRRSATLQETYWVGITNARDVSKPTELDYYLRRPLLRKLICRLLHLFGNLIEFSGNLIDNDLLREYGYRVKTGEIVVGAFMDNPHGLVIEVTADGKIVNSLHSPDGSVALISEARELRINDKETVLYLGSYMNNYIAKLTFKR